MRVRPPRRSGDPITAIPAIPPLALAVAMRLTALAVRLITLAVVRVPTKDDGVGEVARGVLLADRHRVGAGNERRYVESLRAARRRRCGRQHVLHTVDRHDVVLAGATAV